MVTVLVDLRQVPGFDGLYRRTYVTVQLNLPKPRFWVIVGELCWCILAFGWITAFGLASVTIQNGSFRPKSCESRENYFRP